MYVAIIALILSVIYLLIFALCKSSGDADERARRIYHAEIEKEKNQNNKADT